MAGGTIASLVARVGADTSDFHGKMDGALIKAGSVQAGFDRIGKRIEGGISQPLLLAGLAATKFGGQITSTFADAAGVTSKLAVETNGLFMVTGRLADASLLATASLGKLSAVKISTSTLNAGILGIVTAVAAAGWEVGRLIAKFTGLDKALREHAGKPTQEIAKALASSEQRYQTTRQQVERLTNALHLSGPAWQVSSTRTKENAQRLAEVNAALLEHIKSRRNVMATLTEYFADLEMEDNLHKRNIATLEVARLKWLDTQGVMTKTVAENALGKLAQDMATLSENGVSGAEIIRGVGTRITDLVDRARAMGLDVPPLMEEMYKAVTEKNALWVEDVARAMKAVGPAMAKSVADNLEENRAELKRVEDLFSGTISGGLTRGAQEGATSARVEIDAMIGEIEGRTIKLKIDTSAIQKAFDDALSGRRPKDFNSAP